MKEENLIFIISQPRAGSTLLQAILSNNHQVDTVSEPWLLLPFLSIFNTQVNLGSYDSEYLKYVLSDFISKKKLEKNYKKGLKDFLLNIYTQCKDGKAQYFLDKTPRYYEITNEVIEFFPKAKVLVLKRDPLDVLESIVRSWRLSSYEQLSKFHRDILDAPLIIQEFVESQLDNPNVKCLYYEELVGENSTSVFECIFKWLNITFNEKYLDYSTNNKYKGVFGDTVYATNRNVPIRQKSSFDRKGRYWRSFFSGYSKYLGTDFLKRYMGEYYRPCDIEINQQLSSIYQAYYNLMGIKIRQLDFMQFKYGMENNIYRPGTKSNSYLKIRNIWRHL